MIGTVSPRLCGQIERSFGGMEELRRALRYMDSPRGIYDVWLLAMRDGSLQATRTNAPNVPFGTVLLRSATRGEDFDTFWRSINWSLVSSRYDALLATFPRYPAP